MKKVFSMWSCLLSITFLIAQELPKVAPPTPETSSILKYSEVPISHYTGIPNISVPLYTLEGRDISVSVGLSYHAGGHRVSEESTWVGLGWSLAAGGQITRSVRGLPDDQSSIGFINTPNTVESVINVCSQGTSNPTCASLIGGPEESSPIDFEPDDFNYNMLGQSGRFMFSQHRTAANPKGEIVQFPNKNIRITPTIISNKIESFELVDTNGFIYVFEKGDVVNLLRSISLTDGQGIDYGANNASGTMNYTETWDLVSVTSPNNDVVTFSYTSPQDETVTTKSSESIAAWNVADNNSTGPGNSPGGKTVSYSITERSYTQLSSISTSKGQIDFVRSTVDREDTETPKKSLDKIIVYNTQNVAIKEFDFVQDYFVSPSETLDTYDSHLESTSSTDFLFKRLYLNEVIEKGLYNGNDPSQDISHKFSYNGTNLPHKRSNSQDHWGYFNNETNSSLIPQTTVQVPTSPASNITFGTANRDCNPTYSKARMLNKITYPEGAITTLFYENNRTNPIDDGGDYFGGLRVEKIQTATLGKIVNKRSYKYEFGRVLSTPEYYSYRKNSSLPGDPIEAITFSSDSWVSLITTQHGYVGYEKVHETINDTNNSNLIIQSNNDYVGYSKPKTPSYDSKTITREFSQGTPFSAFIGAPSVGNWQGGKLLSENIGEQTEKTYNYNSYTASADGSLNYVDGLNINRNSSDWITNNPNQYDCQNNVTPCDITPSRYRLWQGVKLQSNVTTVLNENGQQITTAEDTFYESIPDHYNPTKTIMTNSEGEILTTDVKYPYETNQTSLLIKNILSVPISTTSYNGNKVLGSVYNDYAVFSNLNVLPSSIKTSKGTDSSTTLENRIEFVSYTDLGQVREVRKSGGTSITYVWGYNYNYPVAKIINATYSEVNALLDEQTLQSYTGNTLHDAFQPLRNGLPNAQIETFSYIPLIGLDQHRDARGKPVFFHYDALGRLQYVLDQNSKVLSENKYNYNGN